MIFSNITMKLYEEEKLVEFHLIVVLLTKFLNKLISYEIFINELKQGKLVSVSERLARVSV